MHNPNPSSSQPPSAEASSSALVSEASLDGLSINSNFWNSQSSYKELIRKLKSSNSATCKGFVSSAIPSFIASLKDEFPNEPILFLTSYSGMQDLHRLANQIKRLISDKSESNSLSVQNPAQNSAQNESLISIFPFGQISSFEGLNETKQHFAEISSILSSFLLGSFLHDSFVSSSPSPAASRDDKSLASSNSINNSIMICSLKSLIQPICSSEKFKSMQFCLEKGKEINLIQTLEKLIAAGYQRVDNVFEIGHFALRGEILDIFTASASSIRINLFGDEIETIKPFDPWSQRSASNLELNSVIISPLIPFKLPKGPHTGNPSDLKGKLESKLNALGSEIDESQKYFWLEDLKRFSLNSDNGEWQRFIPWLDELEGFSSPLSYFPSNGLIIIDEFNSLESRISHAQEIAEQDLINRLHKNYLPQSQSEHLQEFIKKPFEAFHKSLENKKILRIIKEL